MKMSNNFSEWLPLSEVPGNLLSTSNFHSPNIHQHESGLVMTKIILYPKDQNIQVNILLNQCNI